MREIPVIIVSADVAQPREATAGLRRRPRSDELIDVKRRSNIVDEVTASSLESNCARDFRANKTATLGPVPSYVWNP